MAVWRARMANDTVSIPSATFGLMEALLTNVTNEALHLKHTVFNDTVRTAEALVSLTEGMKQQQLATRSSVQMIQDLSTKAPTWDSVAAGKSSVAPNAKQRLLEVKVKRSSKTALQQRSIIVEQSDEDKLKVTLSNQDQILTRLKQCIASAEGLDSVTIEATTMLPSKDIRIITSSEEQANFLRERQNDWLTNFDESARLTEAPLIYGVKMHKVPTDWDLQMLQQTIQEDYPNAQLNTKNRTTKRHGSVILYTHSSSGKEFLLQKGGIGIHNNFLTIDTEYVPSMVPPQCFNCQKFHHIAKHCTNETVCALCSHGHRTSTCPLNKNNTNDSKPSPQHKLTCSNCKGNHAAFDSSCPNKKEFLAKFFGKKAHTNKATPATHRNRQ
jgi:hypothetical protein